MSDNDDWLDGFLTGWILFGDSPKSPLGFILLLVLVVTICVLYYYYG